MFVWKTFYTFKNKSYIKYLWKTGPFLVDLEVYLVEKKGEFIISTVEH